MRFFFLAFLFVLLFLSEKVQDKLFLGVTKVMELI